MNEVKGHKSSRVRKNKADYYFGVFFTLNYFYTVIIAFQIETLYKRKRAGMTG